MQVHIHFPSGVMQLRHDEPLEIGRGKFGISDMQVSRQHLQIIFSNTTETVIVKCLSRSNPSFVWRKEDDKKPITLRADEKEQLFNGDKISLLVNKFFLKISIEKLLSPGRKRKFLDRSETIINQAPPIFGQSLQQTPSFEEPCLKKQKGL